MIWEEGGGSKKKKIKLCEGDGKRVLKRQDNEEKDGPEFSYRKLTK